VQRLEAALEIGPRIERHDDDGQLDQEGSTKNR
jgi:hypothetical protein